MELAHVVVRLKVSLLVISKFAVVKYLKILFLETDKTAIPYPFVSFKFFSSICRCETDPCA